MENPKVKSDCKGANCKQLSLAAFTYRPVSVRTRHRNKQNRSAGFIVESDIHRVREREIGRNGMSGLGC